MSVQITYFDPRAIDPHREDGYMEVAANTPEEYAAHRTAILNPSRGITLIDPPELPEEPNPDWFVPEPTDLERLLEFYAGLTEGYEGA